VVTALKRIVFWLLSTLSAVVLLFAYHTSTSGPMAAIPPSVGASSSNPGSSQGTTPSATPTGGTGSGGDGSDDSSSSPSPSPSPSASTATSTVTGAVAATQWGPVQVQLTLQGGKITGVTVVQYPNGNHRDVEINDYALPILIDETKQAQSAQIDMVSGATVTSDGYVRSLQSALDQAG
jgi:uncharacterized protein with FMN-binding domain